MKLKSALLCTLALASANAMACYTVYDRSNRIVYNSQTPPVDMRRPIHETLPAVFPGGHLVFGTDTECPSETPPRVAAASTPGKPTPLLTDVHTAAAMNLPHTILPSGVALVSHTPATLGAGVTMIATSTPAPARTTAPAAMAQRTQRRDTVITEMHNPPLTMIQQGGMVVTELR